LGLFQDDEMFLREAAAYLENAAERQGELGAK
jgi:hypothetical protein